MLQTSDTSGTSAAWLRTSDTETFLIVVNFGARHGELHTEGLLLKVPDAWGSYRIARSYADPPDACRGSAIFDRERTPGSFVVDTKKVAIIFSIEARSICVLQVLPRR